MATGNGIAQSEGILFKLEPDGQHPTKITIHCGRAGAATVAAGVGPADKVILSEMMAVFETKYLRLE